MVGWWFWWLAAPLAAAPQLAFHSDRAGNYDIYAIAPAGGELINLTAHPAQDKWPAWSPDGTRLAFASNRDGDFEIYVLEGGPIRQLTDDPGLDTWPCWSPDGNRLAFTSHRDGNYEVYLTDAAGGEPANLSRHAAFDGKPSWGTSRS